ncbi:MAG: transposase [Cyanobacteriota bacterium]
MQPTRSASLRVRLNRRPLKLSKKRAKGQKIVAIKRKVMKAKIDTPQGKQIYARRLAIVEPVFANICVQKRLDRFSLRTKAKVDVQWRLFALVHNIGKIHNYGLVN